MSDPFRGKVALVTGAARRLGRQIALALAGHGADLVIHYGSSSAEAQATCRDVIALGRRAWAIQADLDDGAQLAGLINRARTEAGPIHVLVNNASDFPVRSPEDLTFDNLMRDVRVNAWAAFDLCRQFAAQSDLASGHIVNLLDTRIVGGDPVHSGYILAKQLLAAMTRMLAAELAPRIAVNAVAPGLVLPPPGKDEAYLRQLAGSLPLKRHGSAGDVAEAVAYLASTSFVTGQVIFVDGGRHIREQSNG